MSRLTRNGTAEPVSRDQILRRERGQGNIQLPCPADHEQDWQPYPVDPYSAIWDGHTYTSVFSVLNSKQTNFLYFFPLNMYYYWYLVSREIDWLFKRKIRTRLDLLSIPQSRGGNVKTFGMNHRLQIQNLFMTFKRVPRWK